MGREAIALTEMSAEAFTPTARGEGVKAAVLQHSAVLSGYCKTEYDVAIDDVATAYDAFTTAYHSEVNPDFHVYSTWGQLVSLFGLRQKTALDVEARLSQLKWNAPRQLPPEVLELHRRMLPH